MRDLTEFGVFHHFGRTNIRILMVVDSTIRTVEASGAFGIGRVSRLINDLSRGCASFSVDTARREPYPGAANGPQNQGHISTNFRFDDDNGAGKNVIENYDQVWLFGFRTEGSGPVVSPAELRVLTDWMNKGGGVFATGDHEDLGASMCSGIPRLREMRRWTNAQQVPPIGGFNRLDTNRPANAAEASGASPMAFEHERDTTSQDITWVPVSSVQVGLWSYESPHEVLCHPDLGPIDVMPDHPHEGRTRTVAEMNLAKSYDFGDGISGDDFPSSGGNQPTPTVIATGITQGAPPTNKPYKGNCGTFQFPMITVYDGRAADVKGRVATDSTWHHWFDLNIYRIENAADDTDWRKISRYFENLAVWLSPPGRIRKFCWFVEQWFEYPLVEEITFDRFDIRQPLPDLGSVVRNNFRSIFGPCATRRFAWDSLCELAPWLCNGLDRFRPRPFPDPGPVCLTCPPFEFLEDAIFEGLMLGTIPFMEEYSNSVDKLQKLSDSELRKVLTDFMAPAVDESVRRYAKRIVNDLDSNLTLWKETLNATAEVKC